MIKVALWTRVLSICLSLTGLVLAMLALTGGVWSVATIEMAQFPGENSASSRIEFGLFDYRIFLFGERKGDLEPYDKLKQTQDVKDIRMAGTTVWIVTVLQLGCVGVYMIWGLYKWFVHPSIWPSSSSPYVYSQGSSALEDFFLYSLVLIATVSGIIGLVGWGITGHESSFRLKQALESFGLPIANVMMHFGMSYILDCVAVSAVAVCALLQMCIARRNQKIRESGFAGGVISYDTFAQDSKSMPMPL